MCSWGGTRESGWNDIYLDERRTRTFSSRVRHQEEAWHIPARPIEITIPDWVEGATPLSSSQISYTRSNICRGHPKPEGVNRYDLFVHGRWSLKYIPPHIPRSQNVNIFVSLISSPYRRISPF